MVFALEICANGLDSALAAERAGAQRVELCSSLQEGGITPSLGVIKVCREVLNQTKLNVMIRPRGGDFLYSTSELRAMLYDLDAAIAAGADGVVFGCLDADGKIDEQVLKPLMARAHQFNIPVTFHRAFDLCREPFTALKILKDYGVARLLTSGMRPKALLGAELIARLNDAAGSEIIIMPGSGVNPSNIKELYEKTHCTEYHFSAKVPFASPMNYRPKEDLMSGTYVIDEYDREVSDEELIRRALSVLRTL